MSSAEPTERGCPRPPLLNVLDIYSQLLTDKAPAYFRQLEMLKQCAHASVRRSLVLLIDAHAINLEPLQENRIVNPVPAAGSGRG